MFLKSHTSKKLILVVAITTGFLAMSGSNITTTTFTNGLATVSNINAQYCPVGSENVKLDLTKVSLKREPSIPLMYQGYNNIEGPVWYDGALYYSNMGSNQPDENGFELSNQTTIWRWVLGEKPQIWMQDKKWTPKVGQSLKCILFLKFTRL